MNIAHEHITTPRHFLNPGVWRLSPLLCQPQAESATMDTNLFAACQPGLVLYHQRKGPDYPEPQKLGVNLQT